MDAMAKAPMTEKEMLSMHKAKVKKTNSSYDTSKGYGKKEPTGEKKDSEGKGDQD